MLNTVVLLAVGVLVKYSLVEDLLNMFHLSVVFRHEEIEQIIVGGFPKVRKELKLTRKKICLPKPN